MISNLCAAVIDLIIFIKGNYPVSFLIVFIVGINRPII